MTSFYEVKLAEPSLSIDITALLNDHLSFGLLLKSDVDKMILNQQVFCLHRSGIMIGAMTIKCISNLQEFLLGNLDAELLVTQSIKEPLNLFTIGHMVVEPAYRSTLAAYRLAQGVMNQCKDKEFLVIGWKKPTGWDAESLAIKFGFEIIGEVENYWLEDSLKGNYGCPYCGIGCHCTAVVSALKSNK